MSLKTERDGRLLRLTLAHGERNLLDLGICREMVDALEEAGQDRAVGAVLLDAEGPVFCAGVDQDEAADPENVDHGFLHVKLLQIGGKLTKPLVAAVQGAALAEGVALAANAHVVVAAQGTSFALTEIRTGLFPLVGFEALVRAVGERRATELALTGRVFAAPEALQMGLVHEIAPAFEFEDRARDIALHLASASAEAVHRGLDFIHRRRAMSALDSGTLAVKLRNGLFRGADFAEGRRALRENRPPGWPSLR
jgi:enoyl-CoA hydratase/carnithine racemase